MMNLKKPTLLKSNMASLKLYSPLRQKNGVSKLHNFINIIADFPSFSGIA